MSAVINYIDNNKNSGAFPKDFVLNLSLTIDPAKDEYQNFGIMQAQDWTLKDGSDKRFTPAHEKIRYILNLDHVKTQSKYPKSIYISYHYAGDDIAPIADKSELYNEFNACGIDATLKIIKDESVVVSQIYLQISLHAVKFKIDSKRRAS